MTARKRLQRLHQLLGEVLTGLEGQPFAWGDGQRKSWMPLLKEAGCTLISLTQIKKQGYQLKRGAKPVGSAYFGAPIQKWTDLYVLEVQCQNPKEKPKSREQGCWLFLDCEVMTGLPPEKCPNRKNCKQNALLSHNRSCSLFYEYDHEDSNYRKLIVRKIPDYALGLGWEQADPLFYEYEEGSLTICRSIPEEAQALGFAKSQTLPYEPHSRPGYLWVTRYHGRTYPPEFKEVGWYPATDLPFYRYRDPEDRLVKALSVHFRLDDPEYSEAIAAGWHPAETSLHHHKV